MSRKHKNDDNNNNDDDNRMICIDLMEDDKDDDSDAKHLEDVIVIDDDDDDDDDEFVISTVLASRKRIKRDPIITASAATASRSVVVVKMESSHQIRRKNSSRRCRSSICSSSSICNDDHEIEVIDRTELQQPVVTATTTATATATATATTTTNNDIEIVGTLNEHRLPHARQDCTQYMFHDHGSTLFLAMRRFHNQKHCDLCYCFVCDVPVSECTAWKEHCLATNRGPDQQTWIDQRKQQKQHNQQQQQQQKQQQHQQQNQQNQSSTGNTVAEDNLVQSLMISLAPAFTEVQIRNALKENNGDPDRAADWLFQHRNNHNNNNNHHNHNNSNDNYMDARHNNNNNTAATATTNPTTTIRRRSSSSHLARSHNHHHHHGTTTTTRRTTIKRNDQDTNSFPRHDLDAWDFNLFISNTEGTLRQQQQQTQRSRGTTTTAKTTTTTTTTTNHHWDGSQTRCTSSKNHPKKPADGSSTKCQHCGHFHTFPHANYRFQDRINPIGSFQDWCPNCGRVMSKQDYCQNKPAIVALGTYTPVPEKDFYLGTKIIPFRLHVRDPRQMNKYQQAWRNNKNNNSNNHAWTYNKTAMQQELFHHRLGTQPLLDMILASIPIVQEKDIPKDGKSKHEYYHGTDPEEHLACISETEAVILENVNHRKLLHELKELNPQFGLLKKRQRQQQQQQQQQKQTHSSNCYNGLYEHDDLTGMTDTQQVFGDIQASWNPTTQQGEFKVRVYVRNGQLGISSPSAMTRFLGLWFDILPFPLTDVAQKLRPQLDGCSRRDHSGYESGSRAAYIAIPPFKISKAKYDCFHKAGIEKKQKLANELNVAVHHREESLSLESSEGPSAFIGGTTTNDNDFSGALLRYFREILPDVVYDSTVSDSCWVEEQIGIVSNHRKMRRYGDEMLQTGYGRYNSTPISWRYDSYVSQEDFALSRALQRDAGSLKTGINSLTKLMNHLENLGHASAPFSDGLTVELLPFQTQTLQWASERETIQGGIQSLFNTRLPYDSSRGTDLFYNFVLGRFSRKKPKLVRGGIIGEMMGMGKTVTSLALILKNPAPRFPPSGSPATSIDPSARRMGGAFRDPDLYSDTSSENAKRGSIISRGTLVVCKVSLVGQWIDEAKSKLRDPGLVYSYHGKGRTRDPLILAQNSIVVTTYETLASDATHFAKKINSPEYCAPCEQIRWWRIICDESHVLRNGSSQTSAAAMALVADNKWLVSGTPVNTTIMDLKNQLKFLGVEHINDIMRLFGARDQAAASRRKKTSHSSSSIGLLSILDGPYPKIGHFTFFMRSIMMRHSQQQRYKGTGTTLMALPPKTERVLSVTFSEKDKLEYQQLEQVACQSYEDFKLKKGNKISSHYLALTQKLMPIRVACSGGQVPLPNDDNEKEVKRITHDAMEQEDGEDKNFAKGGKKTKREIKYSDFEFTSKLNRLVSELKKYRARDRTSKSLVFSQFASTLKWLKQELPKHGFQYRSLSGDMTMKQRAKALGDFQNDPPTTIFLLSMRAGAVGINLTEANRVFVMEPCFNPALEAQAIGRVHRLGQKRPVEIIRLVMENSVESRMVEMLEKKYGSDRNAKKSFSNMSGIKNEENAPPNGLFPGAAEAGVGSLTSEKVKIMTEEFDLLFGVSDADWMEVEEESNTDWNQDFSAFSGYI